MSSKLKQVLKKRKEKKELNEAFSKKSPVQLFLDFKRDILELIQKTLDQFKKTIGEEFRDKEGKSPTDQKLITLIRPLIPRPEKGDKGDKGDSPTDEELLRLMKPLIPKVEDGETPTKEELLNLIKPLIPEVKDGSPDTPEEIAEKLNTTEGSVQRSVIKGLNNIIKNIQGSIRELKSSKKAGGGGMGNVQHEDFSISSSTTSITTSFPIAQNGRAIMNFVTDNANLELTNHYSVGSDRRTITFDSDVQAQLEDNTTAYIIYIRG